MKQLLFILSVCFLFSGCAKKSEAVFVSTESFATTEAISVEEETFIYVYVCGAVCKPGVYELSIGARVQDAIVAAGGLTAEACTDYWNQAEVLTDGQMIDVPTMDEAEQLQVTQTTGVGADGRVNINTATKEQLMTIPGVGASRAESILIYREEAGKFASVDDIKNVTGIKDGIFQKMKDYITVN